MRDFDASKEMWKTIVKGFERQTLLNKLLTPCDFNKVCMANGEKIFTFLNRVKQLAVTLKSMDVQIDGK